MKKVNQWTAYGDVNPIEHGGVWMRQDTETCYQVVTVKPYDDIESQWLVTDSYIDMSDSWIDRLRVASYVGCHRDDITAMDVVSYYGEYHCNGSMDKLYSRQDVKKWIRSHGIKVR